jgi:uncharacterized protein YdeI (YjbR/CyaY-like superfamily)
METLADLPVLLFPSAQAWEDWLSEHHAQPHGVWLKHAKKGAAVASLSYAEALDGALCYGWIDGQKRSYDDQFWLQKYTPRRPRSVWSKTNTDKATQLIAAGRMQPVGQREVDAAKADGRWDAAYAGQRSQTVPDDLRAALDQNPEASAFFETLNSVNRYAIYYRIETAKKAETRKARIEKFVSMLAAHEKLHP